MYVPVYYPYHCHSVISNMFTQKDSPAFIKDYAVAMKERHIPVLCLTEHGNRSDIYQQADLCEKYSDNDFKMKPIAGAECYFVPDRNPELADGRNFHLIVIAKDNEGLRQLNFMLSEANYSGFYRKARVDFDLLSKLDYNRFIVTTACVGGPLRDEENGLKYCFTLHEMFKENFYLEIQHHPQKIQLQHNEKILKIYQKYKWPLIYATDSHYINREDKILRQELLWSRTRGEDETSDDDFDLFLPTSEEAYQMMLDQNIFSKAQIQEAFENTLVLGTFSGITLDKSRKFPISRQNLTKEQRNYLYQKMVCDGYIEQAGMPTPEEAAELRREMNTVLKTDSADYFISLYDMLELGKKKGGIVTQTSRGSAASYATSYGLKFTAINRLRCPVKMYPERFVSEDKLRVAFPDIDSNICNLEAFESAGKEIFGEYGCLPMIALNTLKSLSAFKMLAKVKNIDFATANEISKELSAYELDMKHAIENNSDDPDYDVNDDVQLENYVDEKYLSLIDESKQFKNIVTSVAPHPCAHLVYHKDLRSEIGIIRLKPKPGSKEPTYCVYIDGATADAQLYVKSDLLRVDVVEIINNVFKRVGMNTLSPQQLLEEVDKHPEVYDIYANGFTQSVNQFEKQKTTEKAMQFKPKNTVELAAFVAAIRPGAKSLVNDFVSRTVHTYGIPAMDDMLRMNGTTGNTAKSSFLFYDEQILQLAQAAGIDPAEAYLLIKAIKKKKPEKVASYKEQFIPGFREYLIKKQNVDGTLAEKTAEDVWTVIINSASYLFCSSHAYAYAIDGLYCAYEKTMYPYEFYATILKLYTDKGKKEKVSLIIDEMKRYKGIELKPARFGHNNSDWYIDKENHTISQSLASVKGIGQNVSDDLNVMKDMHFDTFVDLLYYVLMNTSIKKNQIDILIRIGYFSQFGEEQKLLTIAAEFREGTNRITKSTKSFEKRLALLRQTEADTPNEKLPIYETLQDENELLGLCFSYDADTANNIYIVEDVDDKYSINVEIYSIQRGTSGSMRINRKTYEQKKLEPGCIFSLNRWKKQPKMKYVNGKRIPTGTDEIILLDYNVLKPSKYARAKE